MEDDFYIYIFFCSCSSGCLRMILCLVLGGVQFSVFASWRSMWMWLSAGLGVEMRVDFPVSNVPVRMIVSWTIDDLSG